MYETISLPQFIQSPSCMEKQIDLLKREIAHRNHIICDLQEQLQGADARIVSLKQQMLDAQLSVADAIRLVEEVLHGRK